LLAAALGIDRSQGEQFKVLVQKVRMAVCVLKHPRKSVDFHTVQAPVNLYGAHRRQQVQDIQRSGKSTGTIVTNREFLQDGHWLIALYGEIALLQRWADALAAPQFTLYLGRKAFVLSAFTAPLVVQAATAEEAFESWSDQGIAVLPTLPNTAPMAWDSDVPVRTVPTAQTIRTDVRTSLRQNHFAPRTELDGEAVFGLKSCISLS
jgi:CRISPR system Cascade subunit CasD